MPNLYEYHAYNWEEKEYFNLLSKYRDVFAWSYKEMLGLDSKFVVHHFAIMKGVSPENSLSGVFIPSWYQISKRRWTNLLTLGSYMR